MDYQFSGEGQSRVITEALAMAARIGVMNAGRLEQVDTPEAIYDRPATRFVAEFIGEINLLDIEATADGASVRGQGVPAPPAAPGTYVLALRPERVALVAPDEGCAEGTVRSASFLGDGVLYAIDSPLLGTVLTKDRAPRGAALLSPGTRVGLQWSADDALLLP